MKRNRWLTSLTPVLVIMLLATACSFGASNGNPSENAQSTIKIMYYDERSFYQQYGMLFSATHPQVEIEVAAMDSLYNNAGRQGASDFNQAVLDFIEEEQPDILMLQPAQYKDLAQEGQLYELSKLMSDESFDTEGLMPGILDYMMELSDGKLYGLSPEFYSEAVFYNKDLFEQYGVPLPQDQMSWDELLELAKRFPTDGGEERVYGLKAGYDGNLAELAFKIASTHGLSFFDPAQMQVLVETDAWKSAFQAALDVVQSGALYTEEPNNWGGGDTYEDYLMRDAFISGRLAMVIDAHYMINQLENAKDFLQDKGIQNWDIVTMPVDPNNPDVSTHVRLSNIFAIHANSANIEAAEQFIRYLHSDDYARVAAKSFLGNGLPIRTKHVASQEDHNMQAFFKLSPAHNTMYEDLIDIPPTFFGQFQSLIQEEFQPVIEGEELLENALGNLQVKAQEAFLQAKQQAEEEKAAQGETEQAEPTESAEPTEQGELTEQEDDEAAS